MMRSMFSGVSGLKAHQTRMDVIGNNIANVNTVGFKSGRVTFQEVFSQTLRGAGAPDAATDRAGTNPMQIGLGTGVASIDTIMTNGSTQRTDNPLDMSIEGDGFFVVRSSTADTYKFTRAGNFSLDENGNLNLNGISVYGWDSANSTKNADGSVTFDTEADIQPINLAGDKLQIGATATTSVTLAGNLDSTTAIGSGEFSVPVYVYDSLGNKSKVSIDFSGRTPGSGLGSAATTTWSWGMSIVSGTGTIQDPSAIAQDKGTVTFDCNGNIVSGTYPGGTGTAGLRPSIVLNPTADTGANQLTVSLDFTKLSQWAADSSAKTTAVNGCTKGTFVSLNAGSDGVITGIYSNGQQKALAMVAVATFPNPGGLLKQGENLFVPSTNSGEFTKAVKPGSDGSGSLSPGTLEMSNVDLSREFTDMIITQRGFQANSRIITTSDEMLQELVNLKR